MKIQRSLSIAPYEIVIEKIEEIHGVSKIDRFIYKFLCEQRLLVNNVAILCVGSIKLIDFPYFC